MDMKLLLRESVEHVGKAGDVVTVAGGFGRNYLLPRRLAVEVTGANIRRIEAEQRRRREAEAERTKTWRALAEKIAQLDITLKERVSEGDTLYGSVQAKDIVRCLAEKGVALEAEAVRLEAPIKTLGIHHVKLRLHPEVETELKVWVVGVKDTAEVR